MKLKSTLINFVLFGLWVGSMILVYNQNYATLGTAQLAGFQTTTSPQLGVERWYDIAMNRQKIGYAMSSFSKTSLGHVFKDYSLLRLPMGGVTREVLMDFYAVVDTDFAIKNFTFGLSSDEYSTNIFGHVIGAKLELKIKSDSSSTTVMLPVSKGIYLTGTVPLVLTAKGFPKGDFSLSTIDPISLVITDMLVSVGEPEEINANGKNYLAYKVKMTTAGMTSTSFITGDGTVIKEEEAGGMTVALTSKEKALDIPESVQNWDMLKSLAVGVEGSIEDARQTTYLKIEMTGIENAAFDLNDDFQKIISTSPLVVAVKPAGFRTSRIPEEKFRKPQPLIQSDDPKIMLVARQIVGNLANDSMQIQALVSWVYANVEKDYVISLPSAIEVLKVKKGDCNEHTALFTALARSLGIPTKICLGIVYKDGLFFYHAWPAVYTGGRWLPVDPTFGQQVTDATHIKLLEGSYESTVGLMRVVGKLNVKIIDYSPRAILAEIP